MKSLLVLLAVLSGITQPAQAAMNARVREAVDSPILAGALAYVVGAMILGLLHLTGVLGRGDLGAARGVPWWGWFAGVIGAFQVVVALSAVREVSAAVLTACTVSGQLSSALVLDHFGALGLEKHSVSTSRIIGVVLLVAGTVLMGRR